VIFCPHYSHRQTCCDVFIFDLLSNTNTPIPRRTHKQMVDVAVEEGGISGGTNGGEDRWGDVLGLATEVRSGVIAVSLADWT